MFLQETPPTVQEIKADILHYTQTRDYFLRVQTCLPCEGIGKKMSSEEIGQHLTQLTSWHVLTEQPEKLYKLFIFENFAEALSFINKVGDIAEKNGHHPDITLFNYNKVKIYLYTHALQGLTLNDFIIAAKIDELFT